VSRLAVVGGNAAGMSAAAVARRRDPKLDVLVLERGPYTSYSACGIPYLVAGIVEGPDRLIAPSPDEFRRAGIDVRTLCEVTEIDLSTRMLAFRDHNARAERREGFDQLVYATGAVAVAPPVPGAEMVEPVRTGRAQNPTRAHRPWSPCRTRILPCRRRESRSARGSRTAAHAVRDAWAGRKAGSRATHCTARLIQGRRRGRRPYRESGGA
jgi:NADPH-dependent 2,4-dienoyl-CoA reductase/sulfur reductase-like enzyme